LNAQITNPKISPDQLELILKTNFMEALKDSSLRSFSFSSSAKTLIVEDPNKTIAILVYREIEPDRLAEIDFVVTAVDHRRKGLAGLLIENLGAKYSEIWLELSSNNSKALSFYKKHGFLVQGERPNYYEIGVDALNMVKAREA